MDSEEGALVIGSTPVRTVRNLKNNRQQSTTNLREEGDNEEEARQRRGSQAALSKTLQLHQSSSLGSVDDGSSNSSGSSRATKSGNNTVKASDDNHPSSSSLSAKPSVDNFAQAIKANTTSFKRRPLKQATAVIVQPKQSYSLDDSGSLRSIAQQQQVPSMSSSTREGASINTFSRRLDDTNTRSTANCDTSPLNDQTNTLGDRRQQLQFGKNKAAAATTLKTMKSQPATSGDRDEDYPPAAEENHLYSSQPPPVPLPPPVEHVNIDMDYAVRFITTKSKIVRERLEDDVSASQYVDSRVFKIEFNMHLLQLVAKKTISPDFRNVQKKAFENLERFFCDKLAKQSREHAIRVEQQQLSKSLFSTIDGKIKELRAQLNHTHFL